MSQTVQLEVSGRVQGVGFRAATQARAVELGLSGWVANRADGSVEVCVCGTATALDDFKNWLHTGPPGAQVESLTTIDNPGSVDGERFEIR